MPPDDYSAGILSQPLHSAPYKHCPGCNQRLKLEHVRREEHPHVGRVEIYRCRSCGREFEFAERIPPHCV